MRTNANRLRLRASVFCLAAALAAGFGAVSAEAKVLAKVNGVEITDQDLEIARDDLAGNLPPQLQGAERDKALLDNLIVALIVAQKAEADKMASGPEFTRKMAYLKEKLLTELYLGKIAKEAATDANVQKTYDEVAKSQKPEPEVHARHILVENEDDAKKAAARLKGGEDFAKVATELSKDPGAKGGDLGWFTKDRMVPEFADAAFKLEPGQISEPVKSQFGWHVIKVEEKRTKEFPKLDQVRDQVVRYVMQKAEGDAVIKLRESAKVERFDEPAAPTAKDAAPSAKDAAPKK